MDYSKIVNSKTFKIAAIIAVPTVLVAAFYGYKYIKDKKQKAENLKNAELKKSMQQKYNQINSVDDFLEGVKYLDETTQYGYDFTKLYQKKNELEKMPFDKLKRLYELAKKGQVGLNENSRTAKEDEEFLELINVARRQYLVYP